MHEVKRAIIMAAGFGKRMYPVTKKIPKTIGKSEWYQDNRYSN